MKAVRFSVLAAEQFVGKTAVTIFQSPPVSHTHTSDTTFPSPLTEPSTLAIIFLVLIYTGAHTEDRMPMSLPTSSSEKSPAQDQDVPLSTNRTLDDGAVAEDNSIPEVAPALAQHDFMFWAVLAALSLTGMLAALEATIITSALPTITNALGGGSSYVWVANAYQIPFIAALPLIAQVSDIFGRRWPIIGSVGIFVLGSGLCGGATSMGMLIAGRAVYVSRRI